MTKLFDYVSCPNYTYEVSTLRGRGQMDAAGLSSERWKGGCMLVGLSTMRDMWDLSKG